MFKLARSSQFASALKGAYVRADRRQKNILLPVQLLIPGLQQQNAPLRQAAFQQRRNLSIHEWRSAQLLDSVCSTWTTNRKEDNGADQ